MNMTVIREKSKIFLWICLIGFVLSLVGVIGTSGGGGFLGGASLTSLFSNTVNPSLYVGKVGDKNITRNFFAREVARQRNTSQFQINATESFYIGRAWDAIITNTIIDGQINDLNLKTQNNELKSFLINTPPTSLKNFLIQNNLFSLEDKTFDLGSYQKAINNDIQWIPDSLVNIFANYENQLKNNDLPRAKLQKLYGLLSSVSEKQIKNEFINTNLNCKIDILTLDYSLIISDEIKISDKAITNYFNQNKDEKYSNNESVSIDYVVFKNIENDDDSLEVILNEDQRLQAIDFSLDAQTDVMGFDAALESYELSIADTIDITEGFGNNSGLPLSMGYNRNIIRFAFDNNISSVSDRITTNDGIAVFRIIKKNDASIQSLDDVREEINSTLLTEEKKRQGIEILNNILTNNILDWEEQVEKKDYISLSKNEESTIGGSFKTTGKNHKLMGCLSSMNKNDISEIIDDNNKLFIVKLNTVDEFSEADYDEKYLSIRNRLISSISNNIFSNWIQYMRNNINTIDVREKSI